MLPRIVANEEAGEITPSRDLRTDPTREPHAVARGHGSIRRHPTHDRALPDLPALARIASSAPGRGKCRTTPPRRRRRRLAGGLNGKIVQ